MDALQFSQSAQEVLDHRFSFCRTRNLSSDPIASATVTEEETSDLTIGSPTVSGTTVTARISGDLVLNIREPV